MQHRIRVTLPDGTTQTHQSSAAKQLDFEVLEDGLAVLEIRPGRPAQRTAQGGFPATEDEVIGVVATYPVGSTAEWL